MGATLTKRDDESQARTKKEESSKEPGRKEDGIKREGGEKEEEHACGFLLCLSSGSGGV